MSVSCQYWPSKKLLYTEGVKYVADQARACWLIDQIILIQPILPAFVRNFQLWILTVSEDMTVVLRCQNGGGKEAIRIEFSRTDIRPLRRMRFYFINGVLMLPSEY